MARDISYCPRDKLENMLELVNPAIFHHTLNEDPIDLLDEIRERFPGSNGEFIVEVYKINAIDYLSKGSYLIALMDYSGLKARNAEPEEIRKAAENNLKKHIEGCDPCRDFYFNEFLEKQVAFYEEVPIFSGSDHKELIRIANEQYLNLGA